MSTRSPEKITSRCQHCGHAYRVMPMGNSMYCSKGNFDRSILSLVRPICCLDCQTCARFANAFADARDTRSIKENKQAVYEFAQAIHALEEKATAPTECNTARDHSVSPCRDDSSNRSSPASPSVTDSPPVSPYRKKETTSPRKSLFRSLLGRA